MEQDVCVGLRMEKHAAFKLLYDRYYSSAYSFAVYYVADYQVAEDIVHDSFLMIWEIRKKITDDFDLKNYLLKIVKNKCLNHINRSLVIDRYNRSLLVEELEQDDSNGLEEKIRQLIEACKKLPEKRRKVVELYYMDTKSYREVAEELDISVNTVKDHLKKAYAFLRQEMKDSDISILFFFIRRFSAIYLHYFI